MAITTTKRTKATLVKKETVELANSFLQDLPDKPKEDLSLKEAVEKLKEPLQEALSKGYSYVDIAKILSEQGIKISALTLKNYVPSGRRQGAKTRGKRVKKEVEENGTSAIAATKSSDSATSAPKRGRGRAAAAKSAATPTVSEQPARLRRGSTTKTAPKAPSRKRKA